MVKIDNTTEGSLLIATATGDLTAGEVIAVIQEYTRTG